ncbi:hypothetical protein J2S10_003606 [Neobacillus ginsengisoli]|uniref:Uncharacterized protein n=1 Tax=Neobacillus ginsengisoli TaxID=904295 RepID=A0ABT9XXX1_9BACI|nr:hypothetical protein [Neobacillus ginsengisoli]
MKSRTSVMTSIVLARLVTSIDSTIMTHYREGVREI